MVQTVSFRIRSTGHTFPVPHQRFSFSRAHSPRQNQLHASSYSQYFLEDQWLHDSQREERCHQLFAELPVELETGQFLLVHFVIEVSGIGSDCIEEKEVGISVHCFVLVLVEAPVDTRFTTSMVPFM